MWAALVKVGAGSRLTLSTIYDGAASKFPLRRQFSARGRMVLDPSKKTSTPDQSIFPVFSVTYPIKSPNSPLNPDFLPFIAFFVLKGHGFNRITVTHSTHRNFQVSPWTSLFMQVPVRGAAGTVLT